MASIAKTTIRTGIAAIGPLLNRWPSKILLDRGAHGLAFIHGLGAGSGWDATNEGVVAAKYIKQDRPVIFDIGANRGSWSTQVARRLHSESAKFYLFEVAPYCITPLQEACRLIGNATIVPKAVSDSAGSASFYLPDEFSGLASLHQRRDVGVRQRHYSQIEVDCVTIDEFAETNGIETIAFVKMDIEGHELFALQGAKRLLEKNRIHAIQFEFGSANVNSRTFFRDYWDMFKSFGYSIRRFIPGGSTIEINYYNERMEYFHGATNYLALAPDHVEHG